MFYMVVWVVPQENLVVVVAVNAGTAAARVGSEEAVSAMVELVRKNQP